MRRVRVDLGERGYDVIIGAGTLAEVPALLDRRRVAVVSEQPVAGLWGGRLVQSLSRQGSRAELFLLPGGERGKTLRSVEALCRSFAAWGLLRSDVVVALGGGVVGDTAGFAAACYHRGVAHLVVPTTLLGQVDAAIGGKTGVNLPEGKNLVGAFHQPLAVAADVATLATLPEREYRAGLGEVAKYAFLGDRRVAGLLDEAGRRRLLARDPSTLEEVVAACAEHKAGVVAADELEGSGLRATLNLGHTLAHALESSAGYGMLHGEAVAVGLVFATALAAALGRLGQDAVDGVRALVTGLGLPDRAPDGLAADELLARMARDKKSRGELTFVLDGPRGVELVEDPAPDGLRTAFAAVGLSPPGG